MYNEGMNLTDFAATVTRIAIAIGGDNAYCSGVLLRNVQKAMKGEGIDIADDAFARFLYDWEMDGKRAVREGKDPEAIPDFPAATGTKGIKGVLQYNDSNGHPFYYVGIRIPR